MKQFEECPECAAKPGSPKLCPECLLKRGEHMKKVNSKDHAEYLKRRKQKKEKGAR